MNTHTNQAATLLPDIQKTPDDRNIAIDRVGVKGVKYPIQVMDRDHEIQHTIGDFTLTVDLPSHFKGTHMSRFLEVLTESAGPVSVHSLPKMLGELCDRLTAGTSHIDVTFPYFIEKTAPVTGKKALQQYLCGFRSVGGKDADFELTLEVPVATLCPCSKEISEYGAHNQRGIVTVAVRTTDHVWFEDIVAMIEGAASCSLFPVLKRPDEKWVTEHAYENPRFVEDMVREVALAFERDGRIATYTIEVENQESIHMHNAYARLSRDLRAK